MNNPLFNKLNKDLKFVYSDNDTLSIIFSNNEILMGVVGEFNNNLKEVERSVAQHIVNCENTISDVEKKIARSTENAESLIKSNLVIVRNEYEGLCKKHEEQCQHLEKKIQGSVDQIDQRINGERKEREKMKIDLGDDIRRSKLQQEDDVKLLCHRFAYKYYFSFAHY